MVSYILTCLNIFFNVLEVIVLLYMLQGIFYMGNMIRRLLLILVFPILFPVQKLIRFSILGTFSIDLSPYILLIILNYLGSICSYLLG